MKKSIRFVSLLLAVLLLLPISMSAEAEKTSGGIYENIQRDQMVKEFEDWCYDEARQP